MVEEKVDDEEKNRIKNSIIMKVMYEQGFKDGVNLIIDCKKWILKKYGIKVQNIMEWKLKTLEFRMFFSIFL